MPKYLVSITFTAYGEDKLTVEADDPEQAKAKACRMRSSHSSTWKRKAERSTSAKRLIPNQSVQKSGGFESWDIPNCQE